MQPRRARASSLGAPPLLLARWVGWVAPVRPTHGVLVLSCPSAALHLHVCAVSWATWLLFTGVPAWCVALLVRCPGPLGSCSRMCPLDVLFCLCGRLGHLAPVHRCARSVHCFACAVCWASWLLFTGVPARCVALRVRCPGPLGSCSPVCPLGAFPVRAVSWATWLLFTSVPARRVVLRVRCPGPLDSCSPVCPLGVLFCFCGVLGHFAPVHQCARSVHCVCLCVLGHLAPVHRCARLMRCFAFAVSWATRLLFTSVPAQRVVLCVPCPGPLGSCSPVCPRGVLCCVCGVLGHLAPVHRCARCVCCVACAVSLATWLLFTGVPARCVALRVRCPGPLGSCLPVCPLGVLPVCAVSWATWLLFTGVPARCFVLLVPCPGPLRSCSPVCPLGALLCVCGVLGHLAPVHRCARWVCCVACAASWATWVLLTGVPARCVVLRARCPGRLGSCSPVCPLGALPVCAVSWATWLLFTGVPPWCNVLLVRCPGPLGSCSPVCPLGVFCCVCGVPGHLAPVHRRACSVCCVACAVFWATWLLFTGLRARCVVLWVLCAGRRCGALTRPSGRWLFVAGRGWVPSGRTHVHLDRGCCCLSPVLVPRLVACCARSPGLRHPAAVAAWHLSVCLCCGRRRASLAYHVAPRGSPRLVRSGSSRCSGRLSRRRGAFPHPGGLRPRLSWVAAQGTRRPAENRVHCACRWPPPRQGRWARSASYPFGAPRWGCPCGSLRRRSWAACAAVVGVCGPGH